MMFRKSFCIFLLGLLFIACDKVELRDEPKEQIINPVLTDEYLMDSKGGLFNNIKWYAYSSADHIIWPALDIYALKTPHGTYFLQINKYYDSLGNAGVLQIQVKKENEDKVHVVQVDAQGCGNPNLNPDYYSCVADPLRNRFTYLSLKNLTSKMMTDAESLNDLEWDIAFKTTAAKLNSGTSGPSSVVGALIKRFKFFFDQSGAPDFAALANTSEQAKAKAEFKNISLESGSVFYLQDGIDRVVHEKFWFKTNEDGTREALSDVWWKVRSHQKASVLNVSFDSIEDSLVEDKIETTLRILFEVSQGERKNLDVTFSTASKLENICLNLILGERFKCSPERGDWDIKLTIINQFKNGALIRDWRIFTNRGAKGPFCGSDL